MIKVNGGLSVAEASGLEDGEAMGEYQKMDTNSTEYCVSASECGVEDIFNILSVTVTHLYWYGIDDPNDDHSAHFGINV